MPTVFTHAFVGAAIGATGAPRGKEVSLGILGGLLAIVPDFDIIHRHPTFSISYGHILGHRGFTHSLMFAAMLSAFAVLIFYRRVPEISTKLRLWFVLFVAVVLHGLMDATTTGGMGVAFFAPFDNTRYWLPWRFFEASYIRLSRAVFIPQLKMLLVEIICVWVPLGLTCTAIILHKRRRPPATP